MTRAHCKACYIRLFTAITRLFPLCIWVSFQLKLPCFTAISVTSVIFSCTSLQAPVLRSLLAETDYFQLSRTQLSDINLEERFDCWIRHVSSVYNYSMKTSQHCHISQRNSSMAENLKKQIWSESLMAFILCNIFPDGKRGKRTQLAGIQQDINWRSHGSGISNGVWETYHSKCVLFSCGQARHLFTLFSLRVLIQIFTQIFEEEGFSLKKSWLDIGPTAVTKFQHCLVFKYFSTYI